MKKHRLQLQEGDTVRTKQAQQLNQEYREASRTELRVQRGVQSTETEPRHAAVERNPGRLYKSSHPRSFGYINPAPGFIGTHQVLLAEIRLTATMRASLLFLPLFVGSSLALDCQVIDGRLRQIDVSNGQVFGVNSEDSIFTRYGNNWVQLPGALKHVTVGPAGVWGVNKNNLIYKLVGGGWEQVQGQLKQIDAGGNQFVAGVNMEDNIYCLNRDPTVTTVGGTAPIPWNLLPGALKYYSCGPYSCWGVNAADQIYVMKGVTPDACMGRKAWQQIPGALSMIEVSTDGRVYGVNSDGNVYRRDGVSVDNPAGTDWIDLTMCVKSKHVSYDLGVLWVISKEDNILACR